MCSFVLSCCKLKVVLHNMSRGTQYQTGCAYSSKTDSDRPAKLNFVPFIALAVALPTP